MKEKKNMRAQRRERESGGRPRANLGPPRRSLSPAERYTGGDRDPARVAEIGGHRGDWSVVRSRKRKATEPEHRGQHRFQGSDWQGGEVRVYGQTRRQVSGRFSNNEARFRHQ
jgi:hypothetical protein